MSVKAILVLCAQALLVKSALGQCTSRAAVAATPGLGLGLGLAAPALAAPALAAPCGLAAPALAAPYGLAAPAGLAYDGLGASWAGRGLAYDGLYAPAMEFTATSGGALPVSSASGIAPVGISVASENVYEGPLAVAGELPFVGTVALDGVLPTAGAGAVNHACGNGRNAMISETTAFGIGAYGPAAAIAPAAAIGPIGAYGAAGLAAPALGYAGWAGRGCGCGI